MTENERDQDRPVEVDEPDQVAGAGHGTSGSSAGPGSTMERGGVSGDVGGGGVGDRGGSAGAAVGGATSEASPPADPDDVEARRETDEARRETDETGRPR